jgi:hypothetical protein
LHRTEKLQSQSQQENALKFFLVHLKTCGLFCGLLLQLGLSPFNPDQFLAQKTTAGPFQFGLVCEALLVCSHQPPPKQLPNNYKTFPTHFRIRCHTLKVRQFLCSRTGSEEPLPKLKDETSSLNPHGMDRTVSRLDVQSVKSLFSFLGNLPYLLHHALDLSLCAMIQS